MSFRGRRRLLLLVLEEEQAVAGRTSLASGPVAHTRGVRLDRVPPSAPPEAARQAADRDTEFVACALDLSVPSTWPFPRAFVSKNNPSALTHEPKWFALNRRLSGPTFTLLLFRDQLAL